MSSSESVRSAWGLVLVCGFFMFFLGLYLSVWQSYWNLHVWNRKEALFLSSVSRYLGLSVVFTSDLEYFALLSSVGGCIGTILVSVVSGRTRLPSNLLRLPGVFLWCGSQAASRGSISGWKPRVTSAPGPLRERKHLGALSIRLVGAWCGVL